jgi:hypothetical protein
MALGCALLARFAVPGEMLPVAFLLFTTGLTVRHALARKKAADA